MPLTVGTPAPDFTLKSSDMQDVKLSDYRGKKNVVLLFVPAAFTGVCTDELCGVSQGLDKYTSADTEVIGISPDAPFSQAVWKKQENFDVTLVSDYQRKTIGDYDVVLDDLAGLGPGSKRAAFVVDKEGVIRYAEATPTPKDLPDFDAIHSVLTSL